MILQHVIQLKENTPKHFRVNFCTTAVDRCFVSESHSVERRKNCNDTAIRQIVQFAGILLFFLFYQLMFRYSFTRRAVVNFCFQMHNCGSIYTQIFHFQTWWCWLHDAVDLKLLLTAEWNENKNCLALTGLFFIASILYLTVLNTKCYLVFLNPS